MQDLSLILSTIGTAAGLLITTITFLLKFIKNAKAKHAAESLLAISRAIIPYIEQAEQFVNYTGQEKKQYVMTKANQFAIEHGIEFDAGKVSDKVEKLVKLGKTINKTETDSENEIQINLKKGEQNNEI